MEYTSTFTIKFRSNDDLEDLMLKMIAIQNQLKYNMSKSEIEPIENTGTIGIQRYTTINSHGFQGNTNESFYRYEQNLANGMYNNFEVSPEEEA